MDVAGAVRAPPAGVLGQVRLPHPYLLKRVYGSGFRVQGSGFRVQGLISPFPGFHLFTAPVSDESARPPPVTDCRFFVLAQSLPGFLRIYVRSCKKNENNVNDNDDVNTTITPFDNNTIIIIHTEITI
jgi:hypothetical protein